MGLLDKIGDFIGGGEGAGTLLFGAGALVNAAKGGVKGGDRIPKWDTVPKPVQDAILETYLPEALERFHAPRVPTPMMRVGAPTKPTDSIGLYNLQRFSAQQGGMFSPMRSQPQQAPAPAAAPMPAQQMMGMMNMQKMAAMPQAPIWNKFQQNATPQQMSDMVNIIGQGVAPQAGMWAGAVLDPKTGRQLDYQAQLAKVAYGL
jgi:hypothetical protein